MDCPKCGGKSLQTKDSRKVKGRIRRRKQCDECGNTISTIEVIVLADASDRTVDVNSEFDKMIEQKGYEKVSAMLRARETSND